MRWRDTRAFSSLPRRDHLGGRRARLVRFDQRPGRVLAVGVVTLDAFGEQQFAAGLARIR
jgi:hypothetical protein